MVTASSHARTRLAQDARFLGTTLPGLTVILPPWGRQLQDHPHLHDSVPGGGLAPDRAAWLPARANFLVPVKALAPISRAIFTQEIPHAALVTHINPLVWHTNGHGHRQATPHGPTSFPDLAPSVCTVADTNRRTLCLTERTGTCTSRPPGSARPRTTHLDVRAFLHRFLQHV